MYNKNDNCISRKAGGGQAAEKTGEQPNDSVADFNNKQEGGVPGHIAYTVHFLPGFISAKYNVACHFKKH